MGKVVRTEFGTVLRRFRLKCGLTQQAVADALHVHRATYSYYESGKTLPNFQQLGRIAKVFGVSRETLSAYLEHPEKSADGGSPNGRRRRLLRIQVPLASCSQMKNPSLPCIVCAMHKGGKTWWKLPESSLPGATRRNKSSLCLFVLAFALIFLYNESSSIGDGGRI